MIEIRKVNEESTEVLALLGRVSYRESHGHFISDVNDLEAHLNSAFSVAETRKEIISEKNIFYIIYVDELPVGYIKLVLNVTHRSVASQNSCCIDKIYILNDFIPLKLGQQLLDFAVDRTAELGFDTLWLVVYIKNLRAICFYEKNQFLSVGEVMFFVNGTAYENTVFAKSIDK